MEKNQELSREQFKARRGKINEILKGFLQNRKHDPEEEPEKVLAFTATEEERDQLAAFSLRREEMRRLLYQVAADLNQLDHDRAKWWTKLAEDHGYTFDHDKYYLQFNYSETLDVMLIRKGE